MEITLDLSKVCIETATKRAYNSSLSRYFKATDSAKQEIESVIEVLVSFLEQGDFMKLRSEYLDLRGGIDADVLLKSHKSKVIELWCNGCLIESFPFAA